MLISYRYAIQNQDADSPAAPYVHREERSNSTLFRANRQAALALQQQGESEAHARELERRRRVIAAQEENNERLRHKASQQPRKVTAPKLKLYGAQMAKREARATERRQNRHERETRAAAVIHERAELAAARKDTARAFLDGIENSQYVVQERKRPHLGPKPGSIVISRGHKATDEEIAARDQRQRNEARARAAAKNNGLTYFNADS